MLRSRLDYQGLYGRLFHDGDDDGKGGGNPPNPDDKPKDDKPKDDLLAGLTQAQQDAIQRQVDSAAAKARKDGEKAGLTKAQQDAAAKAEEERVAKEQADQIAKGESEKVVARISEERDSEKARAEKLLSIVSASLADRIKALEALKDEELSAEFAAITDPIAQVEWFNRPSIKRVFADAKEGELVAAAKDKPRGQKTPRSNHDAPLDAVEAEKQRLRRSGEYGI